METEIGRENRHGESETGRKKLQRDGGQGKACKRDTETRRDGVRRGGDREVINGVMMSTLVSGQGFESLHEWKGGYYTLLLLSLYST